MKHCLAIFSTIAIHRYIFLLLNLASLTTMVAESLSVASKGGNINKNVRTKTLNVAVVGSGVAALCCARKLAMLSSSKNKSKEESGAANFKITLCTSRSKMSTQMGPKNQVIPKNGKPFFDYGVQYIMAKEEPFATELERWQNLSLCTRLKNGEIGMVSAEAGYVPFKENKKSNTASGSGRGRGGCYVGNGGMGILMPKLIDQTEQEFSKNLEVLRGFPDQNKKVNSLSKSGQGGGWTLKTKDGTIVGPFDIVVGAFAQHLLTDPFLISGGTPAKNMLSCLRRVESNQLIVMQVSFRPPLPLTHPFTAAHVLGEECLSYVANNSRKPHQDGKIKTMEEECWTLISSASFGEREFNTNKKGYRKIAEEQMLAAFQRVLKKENLNLKLAQHNPKINRINHWEDGLSVNTPPSTEPGCLYDEQNNLGWCGDFCTDSPNLEGAAISGWAMANKIYNDVIIHNGDGGNNNTHDDPTATSKKGENNVHSDFLPSSVPWIPRTTTTGTTTPVSLVDIGQFSHHGGSKTLPNSFTHTNLVPSSINGYDPQSGRGAGGKLSSNGNSRRKPNNNNRRNNNNNNRRNNNSNSNSNNSNNSGNSNNKNNNSRQKRNGTNSRGGKSNNNDASNKRRNNRPSQQGNNNNREQRQRD